MEYRVIKVDFTYTHIVEVTGSNPVSPTSAIAPWIPLKKRVAGSPVSPCYSGRQLPVATRSPVLRGIRPRILA